MEIKLNIKSNDDLNKNRMGKICDLIIGKLYENNKSKNYYEEFIKKLDDNIDNTIEEDIKEQFKFIKE